MNNEISIPKDQIERILLKHLEIFRRNVPDFSVSFDYSKDIQLENTLNSSSVVLMEENWFEYLGKYSNVVPKKIILRAHLIHLVADRLNCDINELGQLVYTYHLSQYLLGLHNIEGNTKYLQKFQENVFGVTFGQLCVHAVARSMDSFGDKHLSVFLKIYDFQDNSCKLFKKNGFYNIAREVIVNYFLKPIDSEYLVDVSNLYNLEKTYLKALICSRPDRLDEDGYSRNNRSILFAELGLDSIEHQISAPIQPFQNILPRFKEHNI
jgi:hypothetical protein